MKKTLLILVAIGLIAGLIGVYLYFKPVRSVADEKADFSLTAGKFVAEYEKDEKAANAKYLGKVVEIGGTVSEINTDKNGTININLAGEEIAGVSCQMFKDQKENTKNIKEGDEVNIKGRCTGILMDVVLTDCVINHKK